jgi:hypothetical protein
MFPCFGLKLSSIVYDWVDFYSVYDKKNNLLKLWQNVVFCEIDTFMVQINELTTLLNQHFQCEWIA